VVRVFFTHLTYINCFVYNILIFIIFIKNIYNTIYNPYKKIYNTIYNPYKKYIYEERSNVSMSRKMLNRAFYDEFCR